MPSRQHVAFAIAAVAFIILVSFTHLRNGFNRAYFFTGGKPPATGNATLEIGTCKDVDVSSDYFPELNPNASFASVPEAFFNLNATNSDIDVKYICNPVRKCRQTPAAVIIVLSAVKSVALRNVIRATWGAKQEAKRHNFTLVFALGRGKSRGEDERILKEYVLRKDILQGDFKESYHNMTLKTLMLYKWTAMHCPKSSFVIRCTDDIFFSPSAIFEILKQTSPKRVYMGPLFGHYIPSAHSKWTLRTEVKSSHWPKPWPTFVHGTFIVTSMDLVQTFYLLGCKTALLWPDDLYLGLIVRMLRFQPRLINIQELECLSLELNTAKPVCLHTLIGLSRHKTSPIRILHLGAGSAIKKLKMAWAFYSQRSLHVKVKQL